MAEIRRAALTVLMAFGSVALILAGILRDNGFGHTGTSFALVGVALYAGAAAVWWRGGAA